MGTKCYIKNKRRLAEASRHFLRGLRKLAAIVVGRLNEHGEEVVRHHEGVRSIKVASPSSLAAKEVNYPPAPAVAGVMISVACRYCASERAASAALTMRIP